MIKLTGAIFTMVFLMGCQSGLINGSRRNMGGFNKPGSSSMHGKGAGAKPRPNLYVKHKSINIAPKAETNDTGSLFKIDDQRNYLFASKAPFSVDQYVDVRVLSSQSEDKPKEKKDPKEKAEADDSGDAVVKEMLALLPELDPGDGKDNPKLITRLKMKIAHVYENGDALAVYKRTSSKDDDGKEVSVRARIPYASLISGNPLTTKDLVDVHWTDTMDGRLTERYASSWQDEYSLRMSGFSEAKSIFAKRLEDKRQQLEGVKTRMQNQLISLGKERKKMAKEREEIYKKKVESETKVTQLEAKVEERDKQITEQKETLDSLKKPEEKPGDTKDGASGA